MKTKIHHILVLAATAALSLPSTLHAQRGMPQSTSVVWKQQDRAFGKVSDNVKVLVPFEFVNEGTSPVTMVDAVSSCTCAKVKLPSGSVAPGGTGLVEVEINTKDKKGTMEEFIMVKFKNDPVGTKLMVYGTVETEAQLSISLPSSPATSSLDEYKPVEPVIDLPVTTVSFDEESFDFKEIKGGEKVTHRFTFTNTGSEPLKIYNVKPSCGCTTPDWTKDIVPVNGTGFIEIQFDSAGKSGIQKKSITVTMNTEPKTKVLSFQGEVINEPVQSED